jgi:hypothetical protein
MTRHLSLHRESLIDLTPDQLTTVVGAQAAPTTPLKDCLDTLQATRCFCP